MARFPYHERNVVELGKMLARAAVDEDYRKALQKNPAAELSRLGLPKQTTDLMIFKVIDGKQHPNAVALPFKLNQSKLAGQDENYLAGLSRMFSAN